MGKIKQEKKLNMETKKENNKNKNKRKERKKKKSMKVKREGDFSVERVREERENFFFLL